MALPKLVPFEGLKGLWSYTIHGFRHPVKGEHYLSGAIPQAYRAPNDLHCRYWIVKPASEHVVRTVYVPRASLNRL